MESMGPFPVSSQPSGHWFDLIAGSFLSATWQRLPVHPHGSLHDAKDMRCAGEPLGKLKRMVSQQPLLWMWPLGIRLL